jgi:hypothetical protein
MLRRFVTMGDDFDNWQINYIIEDFMHLEVACVIRGKPKTVQYVRGNTSFYVMKLLWRQGGWIGSCATLSY